jgi:seryl-tRNA synthetase
MLDLKSIRQNSNEVKDALGRRNDNLPSEIDKLVELDEARREIQAQADLLKAERNSLSKSVKSPEEALSIKEKVQEINSKIAELDQKTQEIDLKMNEIVLYLPNLPSNESPTGKNENENVLVKTWSEKTILQNPLSHWDLGEKLGILDFENTSRLSGARFSSFIGQGAKLLRALIQFMLDEAGKNGYTEIIPPAIINGEILKGTGQLPKFAEDLYHLDGTEQYLIPTAEVPLTGFYANDKPLQIENLPIRLCAHTPCFRSEAGAAGRDTRGLIRQHQFDKVELVHLCKPEDSEAEHERLVRQAESILEKLNLPYKRVLLCTGDMGFSAAKCYDLEVWFPSQNTYREISSCSNCTDFQARRLNLKFKRTAKEKPEFVHTLNGSGLAIGRTWAAILENYQLPDGSGFKIPEALRAYLGGLEKISV